MMEVLILTRNQNGGLNEENSLKSKSSIKTNADLRNDSLNQTIYFI